VMCEDTVLPIKYEFDAYPGTIDTETGAVLCRAEITVCDIGMRQDGENVHLTAELAISVSALGCRKVRFVSEIMPVGEVRKKNGDGCVICVYAPSGGESSWDVEKRFRLREPAQAEGEYYII